MLITTKPMSTKTSKSSKVWTELSAQLSKILSTTLKQKEAALVMEAWNKNRNELNSVLPSLGSEKRQKDPNAPKKPRSGYIFFCEDHRDEVKKTVSKNTDILTVLAQKWSKLTETQKEVYQKRAVADKARYEQEMSTYTPPPGMETKTKREKKTGPKRPRSAYIFYVTENRAQMKSKFPNLSQTELTKRLADNWTNLNSSEKKLYEEKHTADRQRYADETGTEVPTPKEETKQPVQVQEKPKKEEPKQTKKEPVKKEEPKQTKKEPEKKQEKKGKPPVVKNTPGYELFQQEQRSEVEDAHPEMNGKQVTEELARMWTSMSASDRDAYETEANMAETVAELEDE